MLHVSEAPSLYLMRCDGRCVHSRSYAGLLESLSMIMEGAPFPTKSSQGVGLLMSGLIHTAGNNLVQLNNLARQCVISPIRESTIIFFTQSLII